MSWGAVENLTRALFTGCDPEYGFTDHCSTVNCAYVPMFAQEDRPWGPRVTRDCSFEVPTEGMMYDVLPVLSTRSLVTVSCILPEMRVMGDCPATMPCSTPLTKLLTYNLIRDQNSAVKVKYCCDLTLTGQSQSKLRS